MTTSADPENAWKPTACICCATNCGIEIRLGGPDGRRFEAIRGDKAHPVSQGYTCQKALQLDHYQNARDRLTHPLRRRANGTFERIDWDTAIAEVAARFRAIRDTQGGESIFYYGGGGQGNHLGGAYSGATRRALGSRFRSNALAQEKTGLFWVRGQMGGPGMVDDFENCEVAVFVGKNPWQSHGFPRARVALGNIAKDPKRSLIVIDPRVSETAKMADIHLRVRPGTDAWLLAAIGAVLVQEDLIDAEWLSAHATGVDEPLSVLAKVPVAEYAAVAGVPEQQVRATARRIGRASSVVVEEDLGIEMGLHSTLNSYLQRLVLFLVGGPGKPDGHRPAVPLMALTSSGPRPASAGPPRANVSPVVGAPIISGLIACNVIPDEILTGHPKRYRAMLVESANPAHSLADSARWREALGALDFLVVMDVAMTETARLAHYILPSPSQFEKWEATFFGANAFHLRQPVLDPPPSSDLLPEPEIHARLCEALGAFDESDIAPLREAAAHGRGAFRVAFGEAMAMNPRVSATAPVVLYRALGPTLPGGATSAAAIWPAAQQVAMTHAPSLRRAGIEGEDTELGDRLFDTVLASRSGVVFAVGDPSGRHAEGGGRKVNLNLPEMVTELAGLALEAPPSTPEEFPLILACGERRWFTANALIRDPAWRKKEAAGALRMHPDDAARLGLSSGARARLSTGRASVEVEVEVSDTMYPRSISLPNGHGLEYPGDNGEVLTSGVSVNELTSTEHRDWLAGTPFHKFVPARVEAL